jgi:Tol biopolymer transport system component
LRAHPRRLAGTAINIVFVLGRLRWVTAAAFLLVFVVSPALAHATLTFVRGPLKPVIWVANDSGSQARKLAAGTNPRISPDGQIVAFLHQGQGRSAQPQLMLAPADGSAPVSRLVAGWREISSFDWSPDSASIAAVLGPELGPKRLVLIDVVTGAQQTIARGFFSGVSFAPEGGQLVYGRAASEDFPPRSDVYRYDIPTGQTLRAVQPVRLTHDGRSLSPLWGPNGKIVFVKQLGAKQRKYGPKNELYLMNSAGKQVRRLTHTKVDPLLQGLYPTAWSASGKRLLAEFEGQDTTYAVTVNPRTGAQRPLIEATEQGFLGTGLSADGKFVLGKTMGFEPGPGTDVGVVPYAGSKSVKVLAHNAFEPSWSE